MLNPLYKSIKARLQLQVSAIKDIQWYNVQYAGVIHTEPLALIEFPNELDILNISKNTTRADCSIRVHVLSRSISDADNTIADTQVDSHDILVASVTTALNHYAPLTEAGLPLGSKLTLTTYKIVHDYKGWLVTWLTFTTKIQA